MNQLLCISFLLLVACQSPTGPISFSISQQESGTESLLVGVSIIDENNLWISGTASTFLRTADGGESWSVFEHPEVDTFQFRDIHAFNENRVALLAIGDGNNSQIHLFSIDDGWETGFIMDEPKGFLNSIAFWDSHTGLAYGDSFDGKPYILKTVNGGKDWSRISEDKLPDANQGEGGFASSGSCIDVSKDGLAWIGTAAGGSARILKTNDFGESWTAHDSPITKGESSGITSIHFRNRNNGFIAGGDLSRSEEFTNNLAFSDNAGENWVLASQPQTPGAFYGSDFIRYRRRDVSMICGPQGADISFDRGVTWRKVTDDNLWVVDLHPGGFGWLAGRGGKIFKIELN